MNRPAILAMALAGALARADVVDIHLDIAPLRIHPSGRPADALAINGVIPGPVLRFREGDTARIHVRNQLPDEDTSLHWHGLLLPNAQDGVPHLTTPPIHPGETRTYEFPLRQSGTYWYHSHSGLQEQRGLYGAIVVESALPPPGPARREHVLVLSDWTAQHPDSVMRSLMRGSPWHSVRKGTRPSLLGAWRAGALPDYLSALWHRLPPMDVSDVAYDAFWINGAPVSVLAADPGETVRLRIINAGAATAFHLDWAAGPLTVVAADGPAVQSFQVPRLFIAMGETYDVEVTLPTRGAAEFRATAQDGSGSASAILGAGPVTRADGPPRPDPYRMDEAIAAVLDEASALDTARPLSPYPRLRATAPTAFAPDRPRRTLPLRLTGDMERYVWSFNGRTLAEDAVIPVRKGEILRLDLVNDTMMHHPLHLHGFFFRLENGQGDFAPLKHTVDVPPMGRRVIEFSADEEGDWFFHCHLLYHMDAGMARVMRVGGNPAAGGAAAAPNFGPASLDPLYWMAEGSVQSHMSMGMISAMNARNDFRLTWDAGMEHGPDDGHDLNAEVDAVAARYLDRNLSAFAGARFTRHLEQGNRGIAGVEVLLPLMTRGRLTFDSEGEARAGVEPSLQITPRLSLFCDVQYDTAAGWEWTSGAAYLLGPSFSLISQHHSEHGFGGGLAFHF